MSPEICMSEKYTLYSDIWALGCIMYELCTWRPPFDAKTHYDLIQKIRLGRFDPLPAVYSPELRKVVDSCLQVNPTRRPETAQLMNLPIVKLMRKEQEVVQLGQQLKKEKDLAKQMTKEMTEKMVEMEKEKEAIRIAVDAQVRREWEVKARLEIDRQVQLELEKLRKTFEDEVARRSELEVAQRLHAIKLNTNAPAVAPVAPAAPVAPVAPALNLSAVNLPIANLSTTSHIESSTPLMEAELHPNSSTSTLGEPSEFPSQTDISSFDLESPVQQVPQPQPKPKAATPAKARPARTGFQRAHTTAFNEYAPSPMDIHMSDQSPISLAGLSLSPRRETATAEPRTRRNIFAKAATRWEPTNMSSPPASPTAELPASPIADISADDEDDDIPALPSPTRARSSNGIRKSPDNDPFKVLAAHEGRNSNKPVFARHNQIKPLPNRNPSAPANARFASGPTTRQRPSSTVPVVATSPARRRSTKIPGVESPGRKTSSSSDGATGTSSLDFSRETAASALRSKKGNMNTLRQQAVHNNKLAGRTLVELAQGRATAPSTGSSSDEGENAKPVGKGTISYASQVAKWELEDPDCPSPFLRKKTDVVGLR